VPAELVAKEEDIYRAQIKTEGKPEAMWAKILPGKMAKFYGEVCLLEQPFVKDDEITIRQLIEQTVVKIGENIKIINFSRLAV
jgi:elongation factor Ts